MGDSVVACKIKQGVILMNLLEGMKKNNTIINTKGSEYYMTTYNSNL